MERRSRTTNNLSVWRAKRLVIYREVFRNTVHFEVHQKVEKVVFNLLEHNMYWYSVHHEVYALPDNISDFFFATRIRTL